MSNVTSQSELTTKETVEQAISDYHESILPYLNGQVPTIANKFSKSDLLSYDEKIVGCAPDGKPLYQKSLDLSNVTSVYSLSHNITNVDKIFDFNIVLRTSAGATIRLSDTDSDGINYTIRGYATKTTININGSHYPGTWPWTSGDCKIQYTKTTDEAIAIGSDTDYSLEEKIVGTWIDGKKLYQKTIPYLDGYNAGTHTLDNAILSNNSIELVTDIIAITCEHTNPSSFIKISNDSAVSNSAFIDEGTLYFKKGSTGVTWDLYVTLRYTKTTD